MKISDILNETVSFATEIQHLKLRANIVADLCEKLGTYPLIYRAFNARGPKSPIIKVINDSAAKYVAKGGASGKMTEIFKKLNIQNPVFCTMEIPTTIFEFHGRARIFIPPANYKVFWSPVVIDLGGNHCSGEYAEKYGMVQTGKGSYELTYDRRVGVELSHTYKEGLPKKYVENELIFDCEEYYLIDIGDFILRFAGKKAKDLIYYPERKIPGFDQTMPSIFEHLRQELFQKTFKNYQSLAWYIRKPMMYYLTQLELKVR